MIDFDILHEFIKDIPIYKYRCNGNIKLPLQRKEMSKILCDEYERSNFIKELEDRQSIKFKVTNANLFFNIDYRYATGELSKKILRVHTISFSNNKILIYGNESYNVKRINNQISCQHEVKGKNLNIKFFESISLLGEEDSQAFGTINIILFLLHTIGRCSSVIEINNDLERYTEVFYSELKLELTLLKYFINDTDKVFSYIKNCDNYWIEYIEDETMKDIIKNLNISNKSMQLSLKSYINKNKTNDIFKYINNHITESKKETYRLELSKY